MDMKAQTKSAGAVTRKRVMPAALSGVICLAVVFALFFYLGRSMGTANMLNTMMHTAHDLLLNTVFYLMGICVLTGALGRIFVEFGVVKLLERILRPLMRPLFNLPGVASLGAVMTFLSDNPAIISLASDKRFSSYFKKFQFISLTNFGTAFGMGLLVGAGSRVCRGFLRMCGLNAHHAAFRTAQLSALSHRECRC